MGLSPETKATIKKYNPFAPPKEAVDAGHDDFRPVSGWKRKSSSHVMRQSVYVGARSLMSIALFKMEPGPRTNWINEDIAPTPMREFPLALRVR